MSLLLSQLFLVLTKIKGEPICEEDPATQRMDYYGPVVNATARICDFAQGGQILLNPDLYVKIIAGIARLDPFLIEAIGPCHLSGIKDPVSLYQVRTFSNLAYTYFVK